MPSLTHQFIVTDRSGDRTVCEAEVGTTFRSAVQDLAEGQLPYWLTLVSVRAVDYDAGTVADVTVAALRAVAAHVEADERELSDNLVQAFEAHGVPIPLEPLAAPKAETADLRLTASDLGIERRAA